MFENRTPVHRLVLVGKTGVQRRANSVGKNVFPFNRTYSRPTPATAPEENTSAREDV